jgi:OOP family OmpA-OmpF porin
MILSASLLLAAFETTRAQGVVGAPLPDGGKYSFIERADLRRYENGAFVGLEYREVRGILDWNPSPTGCLVQGTLYVLQELDHEGTASARKIDAEVPVSYTVLPDGSWEVEGTSGYPTLRSFPVLPSGGLEAGKAWRAYGVRIVDPLKDGAFTRVRFYCDYRYDGEASSLSGAKVGVIAAKYAMRYKKGDDPVGDPKISSITGSHTVSIELSPTSERLSFMRDLVEESYALADGGSVAYRGFILTWFNAAAPLDGAIAGQIASDLSRSGAADIEVTRRDEGISISVNNIHFIAEQAVVLPEEKPRLAALADALKKIPARTFRVVGHTARVGTEESQYDLSVRRAKAIVDFLVSQGIPADRFLYEGKGGTEPVAPNDTEENMAKNRRVEIVILED